MILDATALYIPKLVVGIVVLVIGLWLIKRVIKFTERTMIKRNVDVSLVPFLKGMIGAVLKVLLFVSVAQMIGFETTSFIAILGAAGLAVGLALQGSLANFAGGALILLFKPFKVGDLIESEGKIGVVKEIQIFNTIIISPGNRRTILPNGNVSNGTIVNHTVEGIVRVDMVVGIGYGEDIKTARAVILEVMNSNPQILKDPVASVNVLELADSSVNLGIRPFCKPEDYWSVFFKVIEDVKYALDEKGIEIPFPQQVSYEYKMGTKE